MPGSIAEVEYVPLGGLEQWVMVRGENRDNPALIFLHGGPGFSETWMLRRFNAALEKHFTFVHWDERGTGKSFSRKIPRESMRVEQFISDLDELVERVRRRLGKAKVALFGHSWGSALGVLYAARFPEKVSVYVGAGQFGDAAAAEAASYAYAVEEARRQGDERTLEKLRGIGPPPYPAESLWTERFAVQHLDRQLGLKTMSGMGRAMLAGPERSVLDLPNLFRGFRFSIEAMWEETSRLNLFEAAPELKMPVFFFLGRRDHWVPPQTAVAYLGALQAPTKELLWFENSGHEPFIDEPEKFNAAMIDRVRPAAIRPN